MSSSSEAWTAGVRGAEGVAVFRTDLGLLGVSVLKEELCESQRSRCCLSNSVGVADEVVSVRSAEIVSIGFLFLSFV
jgi:2-phospho-L-lactate guanylyltransferase (CobY/MobA/RfbA family)